MENLVQDGTVDIGYAIGFLPTWLAIILVPLVSACLGLVVFYLLRQLAHRLGPHKNAYWQRLTAQAPGLIRSGLVILFIALSLPLIPLSSSGLDIARHILFIAVIIIVTRVAQLAMKLAMMLHLQRIKTNSSDKMLIRKHVTQIGILQRIAAIVIAIIGISAILMTFEAVRQYGISLLASAGAASLVVGLALQPMLRNIFAGIQLAVTQPIRIGDTLVIDGEQGEVQEITSTYVVVRSWDQRLLIIPLNYFIEKSFQNWTRQETGLTADIRMIVDLSAPVNVIREKAKELITASPLWDGKVFSVQVNDLRADAMEIQILASGASANATSNIKAMLREELASYLSREYPQIWVRKAAARPPDSPPSP